MEIEANLYRRDGRWVLNVPVESWILDDVMYDKERKNPEFVDIILSDEANYRQGGTTQWIGAGSIEPDEKVIQASAIFERVEAEE